MKRFANLKRLGFFTRLLDEATPAERYRLAAEQIRHAEAAGLDSAWIAQHHFHEREGGLPAPFAFLGFVAAQSSRIRLGTGIVTLPLENPIRLAEDAAVLDLLSNGRFELGVGTGGNPSAFAAFGLDSAKREEAMRLADIGLRRARDSFIAGGHAPPGEALGDMITAFDTHVGTPDDVIASLRADSTLERVTDLVFQAHSIDPPHRFILRSIELIAEKVAPAVGWAGMAASGAALVNE